MKAGYSSSNTVILSFFEQAYSNKKFNFNFKIKNVQSYHTKAKLANDTLLAFS